MLNTMRNAAGRWIVRVLLGLLVPASRFGVSKAYFWAGSTATLPRSAAGDITVEEFQRRYQDQMAMLSNQIGRQLSPQEARAFGVGQNVLQNLIQTTASTFMPSGLGLGISEDAIRSAIQTEPSFKGANDAFDRGRFDEILRNMGLSEPASSPASARTWSASQVVGAMSRVASACPRRCSTRSTTTAMTSGS